MRFHRLQESLSDLSAIDWVTGNTIKDDRERRLQGAHEADLIARSQKFFAVTKNLPEVSFSCRKVGQNTSAFSAIYECDKLQRIPFDTCCFEFDSENGFSYFVACIALKKDMSSVSGWVYGFNRKSVPNFHFPIGTFHYSTARGQIEISAPINYWRARYDMQKTTIERVLDEAGESICWHVRGVCAFVEVLGCVNVEKKNNPAPEALNRKRSASGKLPLYSYWTLAIKPGVGARGEPLGGHHESPRIHLRRGHIKKRKTGNFWWRPCAVGDRKRGVVMKDYELKGTQ